MQLALRALRTNICNRFFEAEIPAVFGVLKNELQLFLSEHKQNTEIHGVLKETAKSLANRVLPRRVRSTNSALWGVLVPL